MKWIVLEEDPKSDNYIAAMAVGEERVLKIESKPCSTFRTKELALVRARELKEKFKVRSIRFFYLEGSSAFV